MQHECICNQRPKSHSHLAIALGIRSWQRLKGKCNTITETSQGGPHPPQHSPRHSSHIRACYSCATLCNHPKRSQLGHFITYVQRLVAGSHMGPVSCSGHDTCMANMGCHVVLQPEARRASKVMQPLKMRPAPGQEAPQLQAGSQPPSVVPTPARSSPEG